MQFVYSVKLGHLKLGEAVDLNLFQIINYKYTFVKYSILSILFIALFGKLKHFFSKR